MFRRPFFFLLSCLVLLVPGCKSFAQVADSGTCAAFAQDGTLATGTVRNGSLETKLDTPGAPAATISEPVDTQFTYGLPRSCQEAFSADGKWLATVVPAGELNVLIFDRKTGKVRNKFSSVWFGLNTFPLEPGYRSGFLAGFSDDDSLALWRYVPRAVADKSYASNVDVHLQRWSLDGQLLADQNLGLLGSSHRAPISTKRLSRILITGYCDVACYRKINVSSSHVADEGVLRLPKDNAAEPAVVPDQDELLTVVGRTAQKAVLLDFSGESRAHVSLPFVPNFVRLLVPDWFFDHQPVISNDGEFAAIPRSRVAWVLVDTDRDWGSEIVLLKLHPLSVMTKVKVGKGGIRTVAIDHRNSTIRLVGFWKGKWREVQCDEAQPDKCKNRPLL